MAGGRLSANYRITKNAITDRETWEVGFNIQSAQLQQEGLHHLMVQTFNELIDRIADGQDENDKIRVVIRHPGTR